MRSGNRETRAALPANRVTLATVATVMKSADPNDGKAAQGYRLFTTQGTEHTSESGCGRPLAGEPLAVSGAGMIFLNRPRLFIPIAFPFTIHDHFMSPGTE